MIRSRLGLKALVLSGLVLGLMAFGAAGAQAEENAKWVVNGADVGALAPKLAIKTLENEKAILSFTTKGGTKVLILCSIAEFDTGGELIAKGGISLGTVNFKGCDVLLNEKPASNCKPHSAGKPDGEILTEKGKGLIVLDKLASGEVTDLVKITPEDKTGVVSQLFVIIELGELCAIGEKVDVKTTELGEGLWIKDIGENVGFLKEETIHLIVEASAPLHKLLALGQAATIIGSAEVELGGVHKGLKWHGVPG